MITKKEYEDALGFKRNLEAKRKAGKADPTLEAALQYMLSIIAEYEAQPKDVSETPIYDRLVEENKFGVSKEKAECIESTVAELLSDAPNASDPGLLLGKIQCGKTDTFETIIGLAFDRGIDITIVLTKGTNALVRQTIERMHYDYRFFKKSDDLAATATIVIEDIMDNKGGFNRARIENAKTVIVAKKEATNLKHLINIFTTKNPWMCDKRVLIVDDEADFASRNYRSVRRGVVNDDDGKPIVQEAGLAMAKISQQIDELRLLPKYCRYLQVTATPYCLFLQPDGQIDVEGGVALAFRPRFTKLVPIHNKYIGGKQYFVDSQDADSMFSHLYRPVSQKCIDVLGHEDRRYLTSGIASKIIIGLTNALTTYLMGTAVRRIQRRAEGRKYQSSAVIHVNVDKDNHDWENRLIEFMLSQLKNFFTGKAQDDKRLEYIVEEIYKDFEASNKKARTTGKKNDDGSVETITVALPSLDEVKKEVGQIFDEGSINQKIVNSDNDMSSLLDRESGQLRLDGAVNIFIGGSILDRGITINNMLLFFYGRDPKKFQQDTVLQHARFYGARSLEDMAVTRLFTSENIYHALKRMNDLDEQLRDWFLKGLDQTDPHVTFVGYDKDIKPCAPAKIKPSKATAITGQKYFTPRGMRTGTKREISKTVDEIEALITSSPEYANQDADGFFEIDAERAMNILQKIHLTYRYGDDNIAQKSDMLELISAMHFCSQKAGGKVLALHRTNRNMSRVRKDGTWVDMPADGRTDLAPARALAINEPVLMFFKENGEKRLEIIDLKSDGTPIKENFGWNNTPFYWPLLLTQKNIDPVLFAADQKEPGKVVVNDLSQLTKDLDPEDILSLTYKGELEDHFGPEGTNYESSDNCAVETRAVRDTTASRFFLKDLAGNIALAEGVEPDEKTWAGVYSHNKGVFPFVLKPYKYMLLRTGRANACTAMLLELFPVEEWGVFPHADANEDGILCDYTQEDVPLIAVKDTIINKDRAEKEVFHRDVCQWVIEYPIKRVLKYVDFTPSTPEEEDEDDEFEDSVQE